MCRYRLIERGQTPEGIRFCILENARGQQVVSIDIESVWKIQDAKRRKHATTINHVGGGTAYHKSYSKLRTV